MILDQIVTNINQTPFVGLLLSCELESHVTFRFGSPSQIHSLMCKLAPWTGRSMETESLPLGSRKRDVKPSMLAILAIPWRPSVLSSCPLPPLDPILQTKLPWDPLPWELISPRHPRLSSQNMPFGIWKLFLSGSGRQLEAFCIVRACSVSSLLWRQLSYHFWRESSRLIGSWRSGQPPQKWAGGHCHEFLDQARSPSRLKAHELSRTFATLWHTRATCNDQMATDMGGWCGYSPLAVLVPAIFFPTRILLIKFLVVFEYRRYLFWVSRR